MSKAKLITSILLAVFIVFTILLSSATAETMDTYTTDSLYFELGNDETFIESSSDGDTIAFIDFSFYFEAQYISNHSISNINSANANFTFNFDSLEYTGCTKDDNWSGAGANLSIDTVSDTETRLTTVTLTFSNGDVTPPSAKTIFATLTFEVRTQSGENRNDLEFTTGVSDNQVIAGDFYRPTAGSLTDGYIDVPDYNISFAVPDDLEFTNGELGETIDMPILWQTNFYTRALSLYIVYDTTKLQYADYTIYNEEEEWPGFSNCYHGHDTLYFFGINNYGLHADVHDNLDTLVNFNMKLRYDDGAWDGDSAEIYFAESKCLIAVHIAEDNVTLNTTFSPDFAVLDEYYCSFAIEPVENVCQGDSTGSFMVQMKNNFKAGDTTKSIIINLDLGDTLTSVSANNSSEDDSLTFGYQTNNPPGGPLELMIYQYFDINKPNYFIPHETYSDLVEVYYTYSGLDAYTPDYDNRFYPILFENVYDSDDTMVVYDTTRAVKCDAVNEKLDWISDSIEVLQAEFTTNSASTSQGRVYSYLSLRNNFDVSGCTTYVSVSGGWRMSIATIYGDFSYSKITDSNYMFYLSSGSVDANGNDPTYIAKISYYPPWAGGCGIKYTTPDINNYAAWGNSISHFTSEDEGQVGADPCGRILEPRDKLEGREMIPDQFSLQPNRPNPFNPTTIIDYDVPVATHVTIEVINILGQRITTLVDETKAPGRHEAIWNGTDQNGVRVASGIYLYYMQAGDFVQTRKMMLMK